MPSSFSKTIPTFDVNFFYCYIYIPIKNIYVPTLIYTSKDVLKPVGFQTMKVFF